MPMPVMPAPMPPMMTKDGSESGKYRSEIMSIFTSEKFMGSTENQKK